MHTNKVAYVRRIIFMFLVFNKQKIISYLIAFSTVAILFAGASFFMPNQAKTIQTSTSAGKLLPIYSVETNEKRLSLTMNCAWNADDIDTILDTLSKYKVHITFFMVGDWVDKYPETVKKIAAAGHEIGNHSNTHPHVNNLSLEKNEQQIKECADKIEKLTGKRSVLYRGPYGEYNDVVIKAAKGQKHETIQWSLDTLDYKGLTESEMWNRLKDKLKNGDIILMHNGTTHTADALDRIIYNIQEKGYEIVPVSELIYKEGATIDANGRQQKEN